MYNNLDKNLLIIGTGLHSRAVLEVIRSNYKVNKIFFFDIHIKDNTKILINHEKYDLLNIKKLRDFDINENYFFVAIGDNAIRKKIFSSLNKEKFKSLNIVSNFSKVSESVKLGKGNFINHGVIINTETKIGDNNIFNTSVSIDHHNIIKNNVHVCPGAVLAGSVKINSDVLIGPGVIIDKNVIIEQGSKVSAGVVLTKNVKKNLTVFQDRRQVVKKI